MLFLWLVLALVVICFGGVIVIGAPYLPTLKPQVHIAMELADLKPGQTLIELGCGDGRVLIAVAKLGVKSIGYEINPILALIAWVRTRRYRKYVRVVWGNYWHKQWPEADFIFTFLLDRYMPKLDKMIKSYPFKPVCLISFAFKMPPSSKPITSQKDGIYLYHYS